ncbi:MAG: LemA family protein [Candidatus Micrarchaeia archaeon]
MERINFSHYLGFIVVLSILVVIHNMGKEGFLTISDIAYKCLILSFLFVIPTLYFRNLYKKMDDLIFKIERLPLLDANEATDSVPFSGEGIIESEKTINSPNTNTPCVYYHYIVEEYVKRGKSYSWEIKENKMDFVPFYLKDRRGNKIRIDLNGVDRDNSSYPLPGFLNFMKNEKQVYSEVDGTFTVLRKELVQEGAIPLIMRKKIRISEFVLTPGSKVYVVGMVHKDGELVLKEDKDWPLIVSLKSKEEYLNEFRKGEPIILFSHILIAIGYSLFLAFLNLLNILNPLILWPAFIIGNGMIIGTAAFTIYNRIIELEERCKNALSTIDVELKRRSELIPNLVNIVKGYKEYENMMQTLLAQTRVNTVFSDTPKEGLQKTSIILNIENYPKLKASENFNKLMLEITDTEERIASTREFYNNTVVRYNNMIMQFPISIIANLTNKKKKEYLNFESM